MTDVYSQEVQGKPKEHQQKPWGEPRDNQMAKVEGSTSATGGFRFGISGTTVTGTVTALTVATPFIVLFSPVLVSVFVIVFLLATGFFAAREVGIAAKTGLSRSYKYVTDANRNRIQEDSFHQDTKKYGLRARETKDRDDQRMSEWGRYDETIEPEESSHNLVKAATAATTGTSLVAFSGLTFIGTVIALILATLPLAIFSPVLVPALITMLLLASGFFVSGGLSVAAVTTLGWLYKYVTNGNHRDTNLYDRESGKQGSSRERMDITDFTRYTDEGAKGEEGRPGFRYTTESGNNYSQMLKAVTTTTAGGSLLVFSGLTFVGTVIAVTVATPVLVIFSPVLVPALITMFLVVTGFLTSGGLGVAGMSVLSWIYKFATTENRTREDSVDQERYKIGSKGWETRDRHRDEHGIGEGYHVTNRDRVRDLVNPASHHHV